MSLAVANVTLADSFNTWRLRTNSIIGQSLPSVGSTTSTANTTFTARVITKGSFITNDVLSVNNNIALLRNSSINGPYTLTVRSSPTFANTSSFTAPVTLSGVTTFTSNANFTGTTLHNSTTKFTSTVQFSGNTTLAGISTLSGVLGGSGSITMSSDISAVNFNSTSDARLKSNISPLTDSLSIVNQLKGRRFKWTQTDASSIGLIAQEVEEIIPEIINTRNDGYKTVNYGLLVAVLIEAIKELNTKIEQLSK